MAKAKKQTEADSRFDPGGFDRTSPDLAGLEPDQLMRRRDAIQGISRRIGRLVEECSRVAELHCNGIGYLVGGWTIVSIILYLHRACGHDTVII
jgi:hypothetical protein